MSAEGLAYGLFGRGARREGYGTTLKNLDSQGRQIFKLIVNEDKKLIPTTK
jgi:hypothetical protein